MDFPTNYSSTYIREAASSCRGSYGQLQLSRIEGFRVWSLGSVGFIVQGVWFNFASRDVVPQKPKSIGSLGLRIPPFHRV